MSTRPLPLAFQPFGPNYSPILMLQISGHNYFLPAQPGTVGTGIAVPYGAKSVRIQSLGADVWFRPDTNSASIAVVTVPTAAILDGTAPDLLIAGAADTYLIPTGTNFLTFLSTSALLLTWFA